MDVFQPLEMKTCRSVRTAPMAGKCPLLVNIYFSLCNIDYKHILSTQDSSYRLNHVFQNCLVGWSVTVDLGEGKSQYQVNIYQK